MYISNRSLCLGIPIITHEYLDRDMPKIFTRQNHLNYKNLEQILCQDLGYRLDSYRQQTQFPPFCSLFLFSLPSYQFFIHFCCVLYNVPPPTLSPLWGNGGRGKREERGGWVNKKLKREIFLLFSNNILLTICNVCLCCIKLSFQLGYLKTKFK